MNFVPTTSLNVCMIIIDIDASNRIRRAKVTFSYAADNNDELTLQPGQVFNIFDAGLAACTQWPARV